MIDGHIHYIEYMGADLLDQVVEEYQYRAVALQCIPDSAGRETLEDAWAYRERCVVPVYVFGGIRRELYDLPEQELRDALVREVKDLMAKGCTGIKMLEGKPNVRKEFPVPDFDEPVWEAYWAYLEQEQIPVYMHVNDPEEFWNPSEVSEFAKKAGWFYDETYVNNEDQYRQMQHVLERHPNLRILFPHFYFMSKQLGRLSKLLDSFRNVRIDITPGSELYYNLSEDRDQAKAFFLRYQDRICYGSDIGARVLVADKPKRLSMEESRSRVRLIREFLETKGEYPLRPDGYYICASERIMHGLGLDESVLDKIYDKNFLHFIKEE